MNDVCLFKTNLLGSYVCMSKRDFSAYQGWFLFNERKWDLFKVVDFIKGDFEYFLSDSTLFLKSGVSQEIVVDLDFRSIHDFDDSGRIYEFYEKDDLFIVCYKKFSDNSLNNLSFTRYLAIKGLESKNLISSWVKKFYPYDAVRKASCDIHVFRLLEGVAQNLTFGFGSSEEEAVVNARVIAKDRGDDVEFGVVSQKKLADSVGDVIFDVSRAFSSCVKFNSRGGPLIFAGYPWFYQVWGRDECLSLTGLFHQNKFDLAKMIILRNLNTIGGSGILPNRFPSSVLGSADATGWLFQRISLFLKKSKYVVFKKNELELIENKLDLFLSACKKKSYKGLVYNGPKETWMDTTDPDFFDTREGARVEIQALYLSALDLKILLRKIAGDLVGVSRFGHLFAKKKTLIRNQLIKDNIIFDGVKDGVLDLTPRPNVFLAYYAYPSLASKSQWNLTFDFVLSECWLDWGGFSSIAKSHYLFKDTYSGMDNVSYHRGDSWFFINNIAAISMFVLDFKKYSSFILKIKDASVFECKSSGFIGFCAEVSSAKNLESCGCLNQAWSSATLLELLCRLRLS